MVVIGVLSSKISDVGTAFSLLSDVKIGCFIGEAAILNDSSFEDTFNCQF